MTSDESSCLEGLYLSDGAAHGPPNVFPCRERESESDSRRDFNPPQFGLDTPNAVGAPNLSTLAPKPRLARSKIIFSGIEVLKIVGRVSAPEICPYVALVTSGRLCSNSQNTHGPVAQR